MSDRAKRAVARSYGVERGAVGVTGAVALLLGAAVLVLGAGWLGAVRAGRPLIDPIAVETLAAGATVARVVAIAVSVLLVVAGMMLLVRTLRPERHPDLTLDQGVVVTASAIADAVAADAESVDGVTRAKVAVVGERGAPALRVRLWLREGASVRSVWQELDGRVLARARDSLGVTSLPTAVRIELGAAARQRVR